MPLVYALVARARGAGGGGAAAPLAHHAVAGAAGDLEAVAMECYSNFEVRQAACGMKGLSAAPRLHINAWGTQSGRVAGRSAKEGSLLARD
jgi:hypothetical protein